MGSGYGTTIQMRRVLDRMKFRRDDPTAHQVYLVLQSQLDLRIRLAVAKSVLVMEGYMVRRRLADVISKGMKGLLPVSMQETVKMQTLP